MFTIVLQGGCLKFALFFDGELFGFVVDEFHKYMLEYRVNQVQTSQLNPWRYTSAS